MKSMMKSGVAMVALLVVSIASAAPKCKTPAECVLVLDGTVSSGVGGSALPIAGAAITIYQARDGGPKALGRGTSDGSGHFSIDLPADDSDGIRYAVARKGNAVELATIIGPETPPSIVLNEMTTVATGYAMAQFFGKTTDIKGKSLPLQIGAGMAENLASAHTGTASLVIQTSPNANQTNAWRSLGTLANILAGCVRDVDTACSQLFTLTAPAKGPKPATTLEALLGIAHNPTTNVQQLFALGEAVKPYQPYLLPQHGPNSSDYEQRLDGFTLAIKFNATGRINGSGEEECPFGGTGNIAFDQNGYVWITNNVVQGTPVSTDCFAVLKPNGEPADGAGGTPDSPIFGGGILGQGYGIGIDPSGNVWAGNFGWGGDLPTGSVSKFAPDGTPRSPKAGYVDGLDRVQGTVSDQKGNIWMASYGNDTVVVFPNGNPHSALAFNDCNPIPVNCSTLPFHIQIDDEGFAWVSYEGSSTLARFAIGNAGLERQFKVALGSGGNPKGVALDSKGNAWVAAGAATLIYAVDKKGKILGAFGGGGLFGPWGVTVDSDDNVWVANFGTPDQLATKYRVSRLCGPNGANCPPGARLGDPISPDTGYTLPSAGDEVLLASGEPLYSPIDAPSYKPLMRATAVHADMAGNLWITNNWKPSGLNDVVGNANPGGDGMVVFVGLAAPVKPTISGQPKAP